MQNEHLEAVRTKYKFDEWCGTNRLGKELVLHDPVVPTDLFPGLEPQRVRDIDAGGDTRLLRMNWTDPEYPESLVLMDLRICPSRESAHEVLLETLANMQAPAVERLEPPAPGDVAFAVDRSAALAFARANLVVTLSNGTSTRVPVDTIAQALDDWIVKQA